MTSIAELGIRVDSGDAVTAATDLDKLTDAGKKTEEGSKKAGDAWGRSLSKISTNTQQTVRELQLLNSKQDETARVLITVGQSIQQSAVAFASAASAMAAMRAQAEQANAAQAVTAQTADKTAAAIVKEAGAFGEAATKIAPAVDALNKIDQANRKIIEGAGRAPALIDTPVVNAGAQALGKTRVELEKTGTTLDKTGMSAKATAAALRGVPAQFTDIFVSLQGGQAPLTVLLQQGGQLKDMFGGIGPAARALGGYVAGLITPFTAAAAAAAAVGVAYYKGGQEAQEYEKALILTGNAAGSSADSLAGLASQVSATIGTTGAAADVLAQLAGSGKIAGESFGLVATAALQMRDATGRAVEETISEFIKIAKDPVEAAKTLSEQYGAVTAGVYAQITALKEQGDTVGAARVLTESYADTINTRTKEITENLSLIEHGWKAVWGWTKQAGDAALSFGRNASLSEQLASAESDLAKAEKIMRNPIAAMGAANKSSYEIAKSTVQALKDQIQTQENIDKAQGNYNARQRQSVLSQETLNGQLRASATNAEKLQIRLKEIDKLASDSASGDGGRVYTTAELNQLRDAARKQFTDKPGAAKSVNLTAFNDEKNALTTLVASYDNAQKEIEAQQRAGVISQEAYSAQRSVLIRAEKDEVTQAYEAQISALEATRDKTSTTAAQRIQLDQRIADARANMVKAQQTADSELAVLATNEQGRLTKQAQAVKTYTDALQQQVETLRRQGARDAASLGMGDRARGLTSQQNAIDDRFNQQRLELANQYGDGSRGMSLDEYTQKLRALQTTQQDLRATVVSNYDAMTAAQGDWTAGASAAWQNYQDNALNVAGQMKTAFTSLFDGLTDAAVDWAFGADESFGDVLVSFGKMILKMELQAAASSVFSGASGGAGSLLGSIGTSLFSSLAGGSGSLGATQAGYSPSYFPQGRATGGDVAPNTLYQVNENGPELYSQGGKSFLMTGANGGSVTPLTSGGVGMSASAGGSPIQVSIAITGDGNSQVSSNTSGMEQFGAEIGRFVESKYKQLEAKSLGAQGNIRKAINGRA
jgi:lambda family phage tail tape measure protein